MQILSFVYGGCCAASLWMPCKHKVAALIWYIAAALVRETLFFYYGTQNNPAEQKQKQYKETVQKMRIKRKKNSLCFFLGGALVVTMKRQ